MTQTPRSPESLERRISTLETSMVDLRASAEALLQTAQLHQVNFEVMARELNQSRHSLDTLASEAEASRQHFKQLHEESNQRFEIMLADMRQFRIESELRFNGMQTEIRRLIDQLFNQNTTEEN